jgi:superfamily II DNA or RNA helicase
MELKLRDYQEAAVTAALSHLAKGVNPLVIAPTGAGKTVIASSIMHRWQAGTNRKCFFVAHRKELIDQAAATMTRAGVVGEALSVFSADFDHISAEDKATALVVFDEAHHAVASSWAKFNAAFTGPKVAVTATPDRLDRQRLETVGFETAYEIAIRTLIEQGHLVRPMAQKMPVEMSLIRLRGYEDALEAVADSIVAELNRWDRKKAIAFLPDVDSSLRLVAHLRQRGIEAGHADGSTGKFRAGTVEAFKNGDLRVLCNVNLFTEGFDAPETDCVILLRPTQSRALWCQMIGRGLRTAPGKTDCLILDPMWISGENSFTPADAFTVHPQAKSAQIEGSHDPLDAAQGCDRQAEEAMLRRIAAEEQRSATKEAKELGLVDLSVACAVFGFVLPASTSDSSMFHYQGTELARYGVYAKGMTADQADWMIARLKAREALNLATIKQVRKLQQFGVRGAERLSKDSASKAISSDWRMQKGGSRQSPLQKIYGRIFDNYDA